MNWDCSLLDGGGIEIGSHCQIAPGVQLTTADAPIDPGRAPRRLGERRADLDRRQCLARRRRDRRPDVSIGADTVVGAGAVVVGDLPAGVVAVGVPAKPVREINEADRVEVPR